MGASFWAGGFGFFKTGWDALFYSPEKAASKRIDVLSHQRSMESAIALETEKKKSQQKASILPAIGSSVLLAITIGKLAPVLKKYIPEIVDTFQDAKKYNLPDAELEKQMDALGVRIKEDRRYRESRLFLVK